MALVRTKALVIREQPFQDHDKILTLFTETEGKQKAIAKGARRRKGSLGVATQLFAYGDFVYYPGKNFANINEVTLIEAFYALRGDVMKMALGSYLLELLDVFFDFYQGDPELLKAATHILYYLSENMAASDEALAAGFQLKLTRRQGLGPVLTRCVRSGEREALTAFSIADGGVVTEAYRRAGDQALSADLRRALERLMGESIRDICHGDWDAAVVRQALKLGQAYIAAQAGRRIKSYDFYRQLADGMNSARGKH